MRTVFVRRFTRRNAEIGWAAVLIRGLHHQAGQVKKRQAEPAKLSRPQPPGRGPRARLPCERTGGSETSEQVSVSSGWGEDSPHRPGGRKLPDGDKEKSRAARSTLQDLVVTYPNAGSNMARVRVIARA